MKSRTVCEVLHTRREHGGTPPFEDPYRIALVVEGGAMRGVVAGGMVSAIEKLGFTDCFDLMVGSSAGACAVAYLRASQAQLGTRIFYEDINNTRFINPFRFLGRRPVVDTDYLVDHVFGKVKPLNLRNLQKPGALLLAVATDIDSATGVVLSGFENGQRSYEILRATTRMPLLTGGAVRLDGRQLIDGSVVEPIPLGRAVLFGATHILIVLTKPCNSRTLRRPSYVANLTKYAVLTTKYSTRVASEFRKEEKRYREIYRWLSNGGQFGTGEISVSCVMPASEFRELAKMEMNGSVLRNAALHGEEQMKRFLAKGYI